MGDRARARLRAGTLAVGAVGLLVAGWVGASRFESPAQREARAAPPTPTPITEAVVQGRLADEVSARGDVAPAVVLGVAPSELPDHAVVTGRVAAPGTTIAAGSLLAELNGRPLLVLPGAFALYRDLTPGVEGPDVSLLQAGLVATGAVIPPSEAGRYGARTAAAVADLYRFHGYQPQTAEVPEAATTTTTTTTEPGTAAGDSAAPPAVRREAMVPLTEVAVVRTLPAAVRTAPAVGSHPTADRPLATVALGELQVEAAVANSAVARLTTGMAASIVGPDGVRVTAAIARIAADDGSGSDGSTAVVLRGRAPLPAAWSGDEVVATITIEVVRARSLLVPTRAVVQDADGATSVTKRVGGRSVPVRVVVQGALAGRSAVTPATRGALEVGDRVEVG